MDLYTGRCRERPGFFSARAHTLHTVCEEEREEFNARMCIVQVIFPGQICDGAVAKGGRFFFHCQEYVRSAKPRWENAFGRRSRQGISVSRKLRMRIQQQPFASNCRSCDRFRFFWGQPLMTFLTVNFFRTKAVSA